VLQSNIFEFAGNNNSGNWEISTIQPIIGDPLPAASFLKIQQAGIANVEKDSVWSLKGFTSNLRYAEKAEKEKLQVLHAELGKTTATLAALIPIRKNDAWWALAQDERRKIFESTSKHTETGLKYLPAIARKLYHCRDIGQPFDFLTWFEYAPAYVNQFEELVFTLRQTEEWKYIDREIDIRLKRSNFFLI
jgi:chlorite dismutase